MKKMLAMLLVLVVALCPVVLAEEVTEINWADVEAAAAEIVASGEFVTFDEIAVQMWIPTVMPAVELTAEDIEAGYIGYFCTEDESAAISVMYVDADGMELADYAALLPEYGATEIEEGIINGLATLTYTLPEQDTACVAFATEMGYILEVAMYPISDEGFAAVAGIVAASIQPAAVEEAA